MASDTDTSPSPARPVVAGEWRLFLDWCAVTGRQPLPLQVDTVIAFLTDCPAKPATQTKRIRAIDAAARAAGFPAGENRRAAGRAAWPAGPTRPADRHQPSRSTRRCAPYRRTAGPKAGSAAATAPCSSSPTSPGSRTGRSPGSPLATSP